MGDVIIDGLTGANRLVVLDTNGKIPALDGSAVTAIAGANFSSGTIPIARLDTGTTAGKIVKLDGSAKLPAVSGVALTGVAGATQSASDPTLSTNPSGGVGTEWQNTTSGEVYVCTDATAGANVWKNVGEQSGDIAPYYFGGAQYGYLGGGVQDGAWSTKINNIQKYSYTSDGNSTDICDLTESVGGTTGGSSQTHGYRIGGSAGSISNVIDKFPFATEANATDVGNLTGTTAHHTHAENKSNWDYGYRQGGNPWLNIIDRYSFTSDGDAADHGDLHTGTSGIPGGSSSETHGYAAGGYQAPAGGYLNNIQKFAFSSNVTGTDVGNLTIAGSYGGGASSATHGYHKRNGGAATDIQKYSFASDGNATNVGSGVHNRSANSVTSSRTHGYDAGGYNTTTNVANSIEKWSLISDADSTDVGDIAVASGEGAMCCEY